jgi:predicted phage terminase large subunit-like protein
MTAAPRTRVLRALLRHSLPAFINKAFTTISPGDQYLHNWHIDAIAHELLEVHAGRNRRLVVTQPPRSLKSICVIAYVAWALGHDPSLKFACVSYSRDLAVDLAMKFRTVVASDWYRALFPRMRLAKETEAECVTTQGGGRFAVSVGGSLTGRGADVIIIDDPLKADEAASDAARNRVNEWYASTLVSRLDDKERGAIVLVMQRLHEDDLAGKLLGQGGWRHLDLPAIALEDQRIAVGPGEVHRRRRDDVLHPERESRAALEAIRRDQGSLVFSAQYQQRPTPLEGNLVRRDWLKRYDAPPKKAYGDQIVQSWDVASTIATHSDYSVCTTWLMRGRDYWLLDVWRGRREFPDLKRAYFELARAHAADVILIEEAGPGIQLFQEMRTHPEPGVPVPIGIRPEGEKKERMAAQSARFEAGQVILPHDAAWLADLLHELLGFPNTRHDDQIDSVSQFLSWAESRPPPMICPMPVSILKEPGNSVRI